MSSAPKQVVLLVEDDPALREVISVAIGGDGHEVLIAPAPLEARGLLSQRPDITVVLSDRRFGSAGLAGEELLRSVRQDRPNVRCLLMSGESPESLPEGVRFLQKPMGLREILGALS